MLRWSICFLCLASCVTPPTFEPIKTSGTHEELSSAGAALGLSSFHGFGLGNLILGKTTYSSFRFLVAGRAFRPEEPYLVYEYPSDEYKRSELRLVELRFESPEFPPSPDAILSTLVLTLDYPPSALSEVLERLGGEFEEVTLPISINRYGEVSPSTFLAKNAPYAVDMDKTGIRIFAALPRPGIE